MSSGFVYAVGFAAQALFSARLLVQWIASERVKRVMTPVIFWELSLIASILMFIYGWLRSDFAILLGQSITYFIYIRNLVIARQWLFFPLWLKGVLILFPIAVVWFSFHNGRSDIRHLFYNPDISTPLLVWGSAAQVIFTFRFIYQWIVAEKRRQAHLNLGFWILSLTGSSMILIYAVLRKDPVLFLGQIFGFGVYIRNIILHYKDIQRQRCES